MHGLGSEQVHIEHVGSVVDVGDPQIDFEDGVLVKEDLAFGIDVETVVGGQSALVEVGKDNTHFSVGGGVV